MLFIAYSVSVDGRAFGNYINSMDSKNYFGQARLCFYQSLMDFSNQVIKFLLGLRNINKIEPIYHFCLPVDLFLLNCRFLTVNH